MQNVGVVRNFAVSPIISNFQFNPNGVDPLNRSVAQSFQTPLPQKAPINSHQLGELSDTLKKFYMPQSGLKISSDVLTLKATKQQIVKLPEYLVPPQHFARQDVVLKSRAQFEPDSKQPSKQDPRTKKPSHHELPSREKATPSSATKTISSTMRKVPDELRPKLSKLKTEEGFFSSRLRGNKAP